MTIRHWARTAAVGAGALAMAFVPATSAQAQETSFSGQVRPRFEYRDMGGDAGGNSFTSMRVRANLNAVLEGRVRIFVQLQDVRIWGEETNTLGDFRADNFDLHQGFIQADFGEEGWLGTRLGRQEVNLGGQRLVGAVGWTQQGRSFDGARVRASRGWGTLDVLAFTLAESSAATHSFDAGLFGGYAVIDLPGEDALDLYGLFQHVDGIGTAHTGQNSLGARFHGNRSGFAYRGEVTSQFGERMGADVSAYMFGARIGRQVNEGRGSLTLWYDRLSGDDDPTDGEIRVFDTMFATNHKFYGFADLFLNIPVHTGGLGLEDVAIKGSHDLGETASLGVDLHSMRTAAEGLLSKRSLAREIDVTLTYRHTGNLTLVGGLSQVFVGDGLMELGRFSGDQTFLYVMLNGVF